jgi:hypothetical protein
MRILAIALFFGVLSFIPTNAVNITIVEKPLDPSGYGYTSHEGDQQMFEDFELNDPVQINRVEWHGLFSDGLEANEQFAANFNIFLFRGDPEEAATSPEGIVIRGVPVDPAFFAVRSQGSIGIETGYPDPLHGGSIKHWGVDLPTLTLDPGKYWILISASASEPGYFLWNHSTGGTDGVDVFGSVSPLDVPHFRVSSSAPERDTLAFSLKYITVPDSSNSFVLLTLAVLGIAAVHRKLIS